MYSDSINELAAALSKAQGSFQPIKRSKTVEVSGTTRTGSPFKYKYAYAPLDEILSATRPALSENGLALIQTTDEGDGGTLLKTMLIHASGQWVESYKDLGRFEDPQKFGGALTYYRRYEISAILGISSEEDDDANGAVGNEVKRKPQVSERRPNVNPETGEVIQAPQPKQDSGAAQAQAKTNGSLHGKKAPNATTLFWKTVNEMKVTKEAAQAILVQAGNDFEVALDLLTGVTQPATDDTLGFMDESDGGY